MCKEIISNIDKELKESDPELVKFLDDFIDTEVIPESSLDDRKRFLVIIASLLANQSIKLYESILELALNVLSPVEIKEILYQSIAYIGLVKVYDFLEITNQIFDEKGVDLPLPGQSTSTKKNRVKTGYNLQCEHFTKEFIDEQIDKAPSDEKHIWKFICGFAYGDLYTRTGLSKQDRELISFTFILSLRGCENQLRTHVSGNIRVGNSRKDLIGVITALIPFIGFPRVHNALAIVDEICPL